MPLVHDRCICLRKTEYSETSQILSLFSRQHGIVRAIAKGAHRRTKVGASKFDGGIDYLDRGEAVFTHDPSRELATLTEWSLREGHPGLRRSLRGMYLALYAAEMVGRLIEEHDAHPELFDQLESVLPELATARREEAFLVFELDVLRESGYLPELFVCTHCGSDSPRWQAGYFSPARGGVVCGDCKATVADRTELDVRLLRLLHTILRLPRVNGRLTRLPHLTRHQTNPINRLLANHVEHTLGKRLRMPRYVLG